jgi:hypothetical protein
MQATKEPKNFYKKQPVLFKLLNNFPSLVQQVTPSYPELDKSIHAFLSYFFRIHSHIILLPTFKFPQWSLSLG